ncbi:MAG: rhodanese-like domain-containing protein [candidate division KSB1 bacterium]|nr:rhodanese-like domain-containing protein [candidate division KSB1 bacterium]MDZ7273953.1 rhodanese-like domain-containing protein [candidate division KSB1 bacterium]MDZ7286109.1 rhodanese-like domain-containing protein [candidate division KSB1 bacterium]MDZ7299141.1 rhodanese-like domain-containing protein [candidate division KSB1 bacterium]MDZ7308338.1 rhodanese-like domain-containing protein [candidate division KSB1 bacterium]
MPKAAKPCRRHNGRERVRQAIFSLPVLAGLLVLPTGAHGQFVLTLVEQTVAAQLPVANMDWRELQHGLASPDSGRFLIFDVRDRDEYDVSHLPHARHVDPRLSAEDFIKQFGDSLRERRVVFYCSVGYRSSLLLQRLQKDLHTAGCRAAANLRGGIFRWYNEGNPVVNAAGPAQRVHPYDRFWGLLLRNKGRSAPEE